MARLLHGSTDLLQPINLLPNSDFSRSGGYPTTQNISVLTSGVTVCESHIIGCYSTPEIHNVTITKNDNYFRVQGIYSKAGSSSYSTFGLVLDSYLRSGVLKPSTVYTLFLKGRNNTLQSNVKFGNPIASANFTYYYRVSNNLGDGYTQIIIVFRTPSTLQATSANFGIHLPDIELGTRLDFNIYSPCLYEGAYVNPPIVKSLDVLPSNQFLTTTDLIKPIIFKGHTSSAAWHRISMLRNNTVNPGRDTYVHQEFIFGKNGGSSRGCICKIIAHIIKVSSNKRFVLRGESFTYNGSNVTKLRLAYDPVNTGYLFVEAYAPLTTGDSYFVNYIVNSSCYSFGSDGLVLNGNPVIPNISILSQDASNDIVLEGTETAVNEPTDMKAYTSTVY